MWFQVFSRNSGPHRHRIARGSGIVVAQDTISYRCGYSSGYATVIAVDVSKISLTAALAFMWAPSGESSAVFFYP